MKFLECPHCGRQAVRIWEIIFFPSPFWLLKTCRYCKTKIRFNYKTIKKFVAFMIVAIVVGNVVIRLFSINSTWFEAVLLLCFICIPVIGGDKLFLINKKEKN